MPKAEWISDLCYFLRKVLPCGQSRHLAAQKEGCAEPNKLPQEPDLGWHADKSVRLPRRVLGACTGPLSGPAVVPQ